MAISDGLPRMIKLLEELGNPEEELRVIHIAGTNGKGSTAVMTASILEEAGYSVGLYTSPHIENECERIQIWDGGDHSLIPQEKLDSLWSQVEEIGNSIAAEYDALHIFEYYTAIAYLYFTEMNVDYAVLECGLGGRLDSTNTVSKPLVSVITQVGLDHTAELGNTIYKITHEKAGIIKSGVPVVSESMELAVKNIVKRTAEENGCEFVDASAYVDKYKKYKLAMLGEHQTENAATAVEAIKAAGIKVSDEAIERGLAKAVIPGRFEVLSEHPFVIIDGAHNPNAIEVLIDTFNAYAKKNKIRRTLVIFGCMKDKNYSSMIQLLAGNIRGANYMTTAVEAARAEDPMKLGERFAAMGKGCAVCDSADEAFSEALAGNFDCVLVTGSIYLAGAMRSYFHNNIVNHFAKERN